LALNSKACALARIGFYALCASPIRLRPERYVFWRGL
jgi:hypothetical protein